MRVFQVVGGVDIAERGFVVNVGGHVHFGGMALSS